MSAAVRDLAAAGFEFEADVRFTRDPYAICHGLSCADLVLVNERRTILLAKGAFESDDAVRLSLLEIWERYRQPHPRSVRDLARAARRVLEDGPRVGVRDPALLRFAHHNYRQLWERLPSGERGDLPPPDSIPFP